MSTNFSLAAGELQLTLFYQLLLEPPAKAYCLWWGTLRARRQLERQTREPGLSPPTQHILRDINWLTEFVMGSKREPTGLRPLAGAPFQNDQGVFSWLADAGTPGSPTGPPQGRYAQQPAVRANQAPGESAVWHIPRPALKDAALARSAVAGRVASDRPGVGRAVSVGD